MPKIIGYGEDALTYWALTKKLKYVLNELSDNSMPKNCVLYYRPSFGRGGGGCFGEFDSILQTDNWLYLIESKWDQSSEYIKRRNEIKLSKTQLDRHLIFKYYYTNYYLKKNIIWTSKQKPDQYLPPIDKIKLGKEKPKEKPIPQEESKLANNIKSFFDQIDINSNKLLKIKNVLLFFDRNKSGYSNLKIELSPKNEKLFGNINCGNVFEEVIVKYPTIPGTEYIPIN